VQVVLGYLLQAGGDQEGVEGVAGGDAVDEQRAQRVDVVEQVRQTQRRARCGLAQDATLAVHLVRSHTRCHAGAKAVLGDSSRAPSAVPAQLRRLTRAFRLPAAAEYSLLKVIAYLS